MKKAPRKMHASGKNTGAFLRTISGGLLAAFGIASALAADDEHPPIPQESEIAKTFTTEAEKLEFIRKIVRERQKALVQGDEQFVESVRKRGETPHPETLSLIKQCNRTFKDFLANRHIKAIEPEVVTNDPDDPRLAHLTACRKKVMESEEPEDGTIDVRYDSKGFRYVGLDELGGPPYRYYRADIDDNPGNGKEHVLYSGSISWPNYHWATGYFWLEREKCTIKDKVGIGSTLEAPQQKLYRLNTLIEYQGIPTVVMLYPMSGDSGYYFKMSSVSSRPKGHKYLNLCSWSEFVPDN